VVPHDQDRFIACREFMQRQRLFHLHALDDCANRRSYVRGEEIQHGEIATIEVMALAIE